MFVCADKINIQYKMAYLHKTFYVVRQNGRSDMLWPVLL